MRPDTVWRHSVEPGDPDRIKALVQAAGVFSDIETGWAHELALEALDQGPASSYRFLLAVQQGAIAGFTCFGPIEGTASRFDLYWIAAHPQAQGQGLGRALLTRTMAEAKAQGATHLFIETSSRPDYAPAHALYQGCGFTLMGTLEDFYSDGDSKLIFGRRLP